MPFLLLPILHKIRWERVTVILITPFWPHQFWFPLLLCMSACSLLLLPAFLELLTELGDRIWHPEPQTLYLRAWFLDGHLHWSGNVHQQYRIAYQVAKKSPQGGPLALSGSVSPHAWAQQRGLVPENRTSLLFRLSPLLEDVKPHSQLCQGVRIHYRCLPSPCGRALCLLGLLWTYPPIQSITPEWDLNRVLMALTKLPFESLASCSLSLLSMKVAFLVAIISRRRVGELGGRRRHDGGLPLYHVP